MHARNVWLLLAVLLTGCPASTVAPTRDAGPQMDAGARDDAGGPGQDAGPRPDAGPRTDAGADAGRTAQICDGCSETADCGPGMYCVAMTVGGRACVPACDPDLPSCPRNFNCLLDVGSGAPETICEPVGGPCCVDEDEDGYGQGVGCLGRDCNDAQDEVNPGTPERCNDVDDDCDGEVDEASAEVCDDAADNDCDGMIDCADSDCDAQVCGSGGRVCDAGVCTCPAGGSSEVVCSDGQDDDCDLAIDCADTDCEGGSCGANGRECSGGACVCPGGGTETACGDGMDNDCDGLVDCADPNCANFSCGANGLTCAGTTCTCPQGTTETSCADGADTDCDGLADCADPDCDARSCDDSGRTCGGGTCACAGGSVETMCGDSIDQDCDRLTDCADPDCAGRSCGANGRTCAASACTCPNTSETCNGGDDDCDASVDETCPSGMSLGPLRTAPAMADDDGGTVFSDECPAGRVIVGFDIRAGSRVDNVRAVCATPYLDIATTSPEYTYRVRWMNPALDTAHGGGGGTLYQDRCAADEIVTALFGRSADEVDQLGFTCSRVTLTRSGPGGSWAVSITNTGNSVARGGGGGSPSNSTCAAGQVASGIYGRSGGRVDRVGLYCREVLFSTL